MQCYQLAQRRDLPSLSPTSQPRAKRGFSLRRGSELRGEWRTPSSTSMRDSAKRKPRCSGGRRAAPDRWLMRLPYASKMRPVRSADGPRSRQRRATAWAASLACTAANSAASRMGSCSPSVNGAPVDHLADIEAVLEQVRERTHAKEDT